MMIFIDGKTVLESSDIIERKWGCDFTKLLLRRKLGLDYIFTRPWGRSGAQEESLK